MGQAGKWLFGNSEEKSGFHTKQLPCGDLSKVGLLTQGFENKTNKQKYWEGLYCI